MAISIIISTRISRGRRDRVRESRKKEDREGKRERKKKKKAREDREGREGHTLSVTHAILPASPPAQADATIIKRGQMKSWRGLHHCSAMKAHCSLL